MFQQSQHSKMMTIIYLINHSTSKLFNQVCMESFRIIEYKRIKHFDEKCTTIQRKEGTLN
jgi:hypothetical protein